MVGEIVLISVITLVANFIGALSGFGMGTLMTPVLLLVLPLPQTVFLVAIIHWFQDIWKLVFWGKHVDWSTVLYFGLPSVIASIVGAYFVVHDGSPYFLLLLATFLMCYAFVLVAKPKFSVKSTKGTAAFGGVLSGFFAGLFGMRGALKSVFLSAFGFSKMTYLGTTGAISFFVDLARVGSYWYGGIALPSYIIKGLPLFIVLSFVGAKIAQLFVKKVSPETFRRLIALFLICAAFILIGKTIYLWQK